MPAICHSGREAYLMDKLNDFLEDKIKLIGEDYSTRCRCRYKVNGRWINAQIDMDHKVIYGLDGKILRRCN